MKNRLIKTAAILLLLTGVMTAFATPDQPQKERIENMRSQIFEHIDNPDLTNADFSEIEATLHFMINKESEIVVLYVDAQDEFVDQYLKTRLNYKEIKNNVLRGPYSMKITIKKASV
jgi:hypothetical protein